MVLEDDLPQPQPDRAASPLKGYKTRHNLAVLHREQGRHAEAEARWREAVAERPDFLPAWLGLAEAHLGRRDWEGLEWVAGRAESLRHGAVDTAVIRARGESRLTPTPGPSTPANTALDRRPPSL